MPTTADTWPTSRDGIPADASHGAAAGRVPRPPSWITGQSSRRSPQRHVDGLNRSPRIGRLWTAGTGLSLEPNTAGETPVGGNLPRCGRRSLAWLNRQVSLDKTSVLVTRWIIALKQQLSCRSRGESCVATVRCLTLFNYPTIIRLLFASN